MKKESGFKMKSPSIAKLAKAAGSPMRKDLPTYDEAFDKMETYTDKSGKKYKKNKLAGKMYADSDTGRQLFKEEAQLYNAKKNASKPITATVNNTQGVLKNDKGNFADNKGITDVNKRKPKAKAGELSSRVVVTGAKRKANEANKKKKQNRSVTGRLKAKASKFGRMGT